MGSIKAIKFVWADKFKWPLDRSDSKSERFLDNFKQEKKKYVDSFEERKYIRFLSETCASKIVETRISKNLIQSRAIPNFWVKRSKKLFQACGGCNQRCNSFKTFIFYWSDSYS